MVRRKGEAVTLHCDRCSWGTELALSATEESCTVRCAHCGNTLYWHCCTACGLCYAGTEAPKCPICDDPSLDQLDERSTE